MRLKDIRKGPLFVLGFGLLVLVVLGMYVGGVFGKETIYGRGKSIELIGKDTVSAGGIDVKVVGGGYFEGSLKPLIKELSGEKPKDGYVVLNVELTNKSDIPATASDLSITSAKDIADVKGTALVTTVDKSFGYAVSEKFAKKYKLLMNGDTIRPKETIRGAVYVPVSKFDRKNAFKIVYRGAGLNKSVKAEVSRWNFDDGELLDVANMPTTAKANLTLGALKKGKQVKVEEQIVKAEGLSMFAGNGYFFGKTSDEFTRGILHLTSSNTTEKVLFVDMTIQNVSKDAKHVGNFELVVPKADGSGKVTLTSVRTEISGNVSKTMDKTFMSTYSLLNYPGFGPGVKPLKAGAKVEGRVLFFSSDLLDMANAEMRYVGLEKKTKTEGSWSILMN